MEELPFAQIQQRRLNRWEALHNVFGEEQSFIDPGVRETVTALNALGILTDNSCEGHLQSNGRLQTKSYPWISFEDITFFSPDRVVTHKPFLQRVQDVASVLKELVIKGLKEPLSTEDITQAFINSFYLEKETPTKHRIGITDFWENELPTIRVIQCPTAKEHEYAFIDDDLRIDPADMEICQNEMKSFGSYLKSIYFNQSDRTIIQNLESK